MNQEKAEEKMTEDYGLQFADKLHYVSLIILDVGILIFVNPSKCITT